MKQVGRDDGVGNSGFIFQAEKDKSLGGAGALADNNAASDAEALAAGNTAQFAGATNAHGIEPGAAISHGMRADGESGAMEVGDKTLFLVHGLEWGRSIRLGLVFE